MITIFIKKKIYNDEKDFDKYISNDKLMNRSEMLKILKHIKISENIEINFFRFKSIQLKKLENKLNEYIEIEEYEKCSQMKDEINWFKKNILNEC